MLNPELKLNENIFEDEEQKAIRDGFGDALLELGDKNSNVFVLTADLAESTRVDKFADKFSERFIECGVAEQNMAGIAAGLAVSGKIPFISSFATFSPGKNWETIRTTIIYNEANVKIAGHHAGIITGPDGVTHQATEDIAIMRCLPKIKIISPCDYWEAKKSTLYAAQDYGPFYLRYVRNKTPMITTEETPFRFGKIEKFWIPSMDINNQMRLKTNVREVLYKDLIYLIRGLVLRVYNSFGSGQKEIIYKNALITEFDKHQIRYQNNPNFEIVYKDKKLGDYLPDLIVEDKILITIKAQSFITFENKKQLWYFLKKSKYKLGLIINFGDSKVQVIKIVSDKVSNVGNYSLRRFAPLVIFATGHLVYQALLAAKELEEEGIDIYIFNVHTIKPLDEETILEAADKFQTIITLEDHQVEGGLGSAIAEIIIQKSKFKPTMFFLGLKNRFGESGKPDELIKKYELDKESIKKIVKNIIAKK